jgi:hypothetical protein
VVDVPGRVLLPGLIGAHCHVDKTLFGGRWVPHSAGGALADLVEALGVISGWPLPCWGWGEIPGQYQYGRRRNGDDGSSPMPPAADGLADLSPILPGWGPRRRPTASPPDGGPIRYRDLIR